MMGSIAEHSRPRLNPGNECHGTKPKRAYVHARAGLFLGIEFICCNKYSAWRV